MKIKPPFITLFCILLCLNVTNVKAQSPSAQNLGVYLLHKKIAEELGVEKSNIRLSQGSVAIGETSLWLWSTFDTTEAADSIYSNTAVIHSFSNSYELLLHEIENDSTQYQCVLNDALLLFCSTDQRPWNKTIHELTTEISKGNPVQIAFDTTFYVVNKSTKIAWNVQLNIDLNKTLLFYADPYATAAPTMNLPGIKPWYLPCFLSAVYENANHSYLQNDEWQDFFGENGMMHSICAGFIAIESGSIQIKVNREWWRLNSRTKLKTVYNSPSLLGVILIPIQQFLK